MALATFAKVSSASGVAVGPLKVDCITFVGGTYATGGVTGLRAGLRGLFGDSRTPFAVVQSGSAGDYAIHYLPATDKLKVLVASTGAEAADNANLGAVTFTAICFSN